MLVQLKDVRLAFADSLFEPKQVQGKGDKRHSACFILTPGDANCAAIKKALTEAATEKWKDKAKTVITKLIEENRVCYMTKEKTNASGETYQGFEGSHSISASNKARPTVINRDRSPLVESDGKPYAGCYVNAVIEVWAQDNQWGRRLNASLKGIQFVRDGDAFGGGTVVQADAFDDLGVDAGEMTAEGDDSSLF